MRDIVLFYVRCECGFFLITQSDEERWQLFDIYEQHCKQNYKHGLTDKNNKRQA